MLTAAAHPTVLCGGPQTSQLGFLSQKHVFVEVTGAGHQILHLSRLSGFRVSPLRVAGAALPPFCSREEEHTSQPCSL